jgi:hypothetical protein
MLFREDCDTHLLMDADGMDGMWSGDGWVSEWERVAIWGAGTSHGGGSHQLHGLAAGGKTCGRSRDSVTEDESLGSHFLPLMLGVRSRPA